MAHEIQENDSMFSVGETPWHGLGVVLDSPPTILEGLEKANLNWTVRLLPLFCQIPVQGSGRRTAGEYYEVTNRAVLREDTNEILGIVGANYTILQNTEAFKIFEPLVESKDLLLETAGSLKNGRRVWILGRINAEGAEIGKGDEVRPYVLLSNSHDGTMAVRFGFTPVRVVCNNTLSIAEEGKTSKLIKIIHTQGVHESLDALRNMLDIAKESFTTTIEQYKWLASRDINERDLAQYVKVVFQPDFEQIGVNVQGQVFDEGGEIIFTPSEKKVIELFESGIGSGMPKAKTWWGAYNSVNEFLMYHRGRDVSNRLNSVWFADGYKWNQTALNVAIKMAA